MSHSISAPESSPLSDERKLASSNVRKTAPLGKYILLFDGLCRFCTRQSQRIVSLARPGFVEALNFQEAGALDRFPGLTHDACMKAIHLVEPDGRISRGPEAIIRAIATRPILHWLPAIYSVPGMRPLLNWLYALVASNRYRIWGKAKSPLDCDGGTCHLHGFKA